MEDGRIILRDNYRKLLEKFPELLVFGEDAGKIGGVNQTLEGLQDQFGDLRVFDTGIRECTIIGQGIGMAMRGLRPIAEIQYLDYLLYALQVMSDDLATVQYRTKGGQKAPLIIRTRGHRLEGIWHSGSPMGAIINLLRGLLETKLNNCNALFTVIDKTIDAALFGGPNFEVPGIIDSFADKKSGFSGIRTIVNIVNQLEEQGINASQPIFGKDNNLLNVLATTIQQHTKEVNNNSYMHGSNKELLIPVVGGVAVMRRGALKVNGGLA